MLIFDLDASLWPEHPNYEVPKPNEWTCYKRSQLVFSGVRSASGLLSVSEVRGYTHPDGSVDFGNIDSLSEIPNGFNIIGDFGDVIVIAENMRLHVLIAT